jgi:hypothetical protein
MFICFIALHKKCLSISRQNHFYHPPYWQFVNIQPLLIFMLWYCSRIVIFRWLCMCELITGTMWWSSDTAVMLWAYVNKLIGAVNKMCSKNKPVWLKCVFGCVYSEEIIILNNIDRIQNQWKQKLLSYQAHAYTLYTQMAHTWHVDGMMRAYVSVRSGYVVWHGVVLRTAKNSTTHITHNKYIHITCTMHMCFYCKVMLQNHVRRACGDRLELCSIRKMT